MDIVQYELKSSQKSIEILNSALETNTLPSRCRNLGNVFYVGITKGVIYTLGKRIFNAVNNVIKIPFSPCCGESAFLNTLAYRLVRLILIDPFSLLTGFIAGVVKVFSAVLGVFAPSIAVSGFKFAEELDMAHLQLKWMFRDKLMEVDNEPKAIYPTIAINCLGSDIVSEMVNPHIPSLLNSIDCLKNKLEALADLINAHLDYLWGNRSTIGDPIGEILDGLQKQSDVLKKVDNAKSINLSSFLENLLEIEKYFLSVRSASYVEIKNYKICLEKYELARQGYY